MEKAVIFGLDGVLTETAEYHFRAWKQIADALNIKFNREINDHLRGVSRRDSLLIMISGQITLTEERLQSLMEEKNTIYNNLLLKQGKKLLLPDIMQFLENFKRYNFKSAIASASRNARTVLHITGLDKGYFDIIVDGNDIRNSKPDPEVFLLAAQKLAVQPANCIVIEDAPAGIEAAKRAGMFTFGVGTAELADCDLRENALSPSSPELIDSFFNRMQNS